MLKVDHLARLLEAHIEAHTERINKVHVFRAQSSALEEVIAELLDQLSFRRQVVLTPQDGFVTRARPDFVHPLEPGRGIIAEVERGGTTTNNHDLKDLWKAHIAQDAQHLFLIVPMVNRRENGSIRERPFPRVVSRLAAFFGDPRREIDVVSAHIFGYGTSTRTNAGTRTRADNAGDQHASVRQLIASQSENDKHTEAMPTERTSEG